MPQEEITGTEISEFPEASTIYGGDVVAGVQNRRNKKFSFATIFTWIKSKLSAAEIPYDSETSSSSAENVQDALDDAFSGIGNKQSTITASGILKGDGQGNISAAVAGTDYGTYSKPSGGIPSSDMASAVQTSLGKADTAYQKPSSGIPSSDMASGVQTSLGKADTAYQKPSGGIPASDIASGVIPTQPSDIGAQSTITANGILKGDGAGGVSAAVAGTDYQAPLTAGTDYATPSQLADKANQTQVAYVETGTTASRPYAVGEYFCWNGLLYRVTSAISSGGTFIVNTNCEQVTEGGFNSLNNKIKGLLYVESGQVGWSATKSISIAGSMVVRITFSRGNSQQIYLWDYVTQGINLLVSNGSTLASVAYSSGTITFSGAAGAAYDYILECFG